MTIDTRTMFDQLIETIRAEERAKLLAAIDGISNGVTRRRGRKPGRPVAIRAKTAGGKRTSEDIEALTRSLLGYVKKNPGSRMEQVATGLGVTTKELMLPAAKLMADKKLKTTGQKRGMKYSVR